MSTIEATRPTLSGVSDLRAFLRTNDTPIFFVSPTAFNLLGIDRWVRNFYYVTYYDSFEGGHPRVFVPTDREPHGLHVDRGHLQPPAARPRGARAGSPRTGPAGKVAFVMFDEETEALAAEPASRSSIPPAALRERLDSKIVTTQLGNEAGVPSVPNVLGRAGVLRRAARARRPERPRRRPRRPDALRRLGQDHVLHRGPRRLGQRHAEKLAGQELKVMKRIRNFEIAVEASLTRHGTIVGPFMTSLIGHPELTPYKGGWCGNDIFPDALTPKQRKHAPGR